MSETAPLVLSPQEILAASSSSGMGVSYWSNFLGCAAKNYYSKLYQRPATLRAPLEPGEKVDMMQVGIFFHKLRELWRLKLLNDPAEVIVEWGEAFECDEWKEACRLFRKYQEEYSQLDWETVSCEELFEFGCRECVTESCVEGKHVGTPHPLLGNRSYVFCQKASAAINRWGVPCISGRWDEVARLTDIEKIAAQRAIPLIESGVYIVDAKTKGQRWANVEEQFEDSMQFELYQQAWNELHPGDKAVGLIADTVYAYKTAPRLESFLITSNVHKQKVLKSYLSKCWKAYLYNGFQTNPDRCYDYGRTCYWKRSKVCNLLDPVEEK